MTTAIYGKDLSQKLVTETIKRASNPLVGRVLVELTGLYCERQDPVDPQEFGSLLAVQVSIHRHFSFPSDYAKLRGGISDIIGNISQEITFANIARQAYGEVLMICDKANSQYS